MANQAVWVTTAVESFVVIPDDGQDVRGRREWLDDAFADQRVRTHLPFFHSVQRSGFKEYCVGHTYLADVVDEAATIQRNQIRFPKSQSRAEVDGGIRDSVGVAFGVWIPRLRGGCQREYDVFRVNANRLQHGSPLLESAPREVAMPGHGLRALDSEGLKAPNSEGYDKTGQMKQLR